MGLFATEIWPSCYVHLHNKIYSWVEDGLLRFDGSKSTMGYSELDSQILCAFGYLKRPTKNKDKMYDAQIALDNDIILGKLDVDWLDGPHALTLYKVKLARMK